MEANNQVETYVGLTAGELKTRYQKHKSDFNNTSDKNATTLSTHIWNLKEYNTPYDVKFEIVGRAAPYSAVTGRCNLCKYKIVFNPEKATLKLFSACSQKWTALLVKKKRKTRNRGRWPPPADQLIASLCTDYILIYACSSFVICSLRSGVKFSDFMKL